MIAPVFSFVFLSLLRNFAEKMGTGSMISFRLAAPFICFAKYLQYD